MVLRISRRFSPFCFKSLTRWYPRGVQISLHIRSPGLQDYRGGGGGDFGVNFGHLKSEVFHGGWYFGVNFGHLKSEVFHWGGRLSGLKFQKAPFWRIWTKIYCLRSTVQKPACASQIVSHIRMWRLIRPSSKMDLQQEIALKVRAVADAVIFKGHRISTNICRKGYWFSTQASPDWLRFFSSKLVLFVKLSKYEPPVMFIGPMPLRFRKY